MHAQNSFRTTPIFVSTSNLLKECVVVRYPWDDKTQYTPTFTGIPPHIVQLAEFEKMKGMVKNNMSEVVDRMVEEFDRRNVGDDNYQLNNLLEEIQNLKTMVERSNTAIDNENRRQMQLNNIINNNNLNETGTMRVDEIVLGLGDTNIENINNNNNTTNDDDDINMEIDGNNTNETNNNNNPPINPTTNNAVVQLMFQHGQGTLGLIPPTFKFPRMTLSGLITMWYVGDRQHNIPPYKLLRGIDCKLSSEKKTLSKMKKVMEKVVECTLIMNEPQLINNTMNVVSTANLYRRVKHFFAFKRVNELGYERAQKRLESLSWKTTYNYLVKRDFRFMGEW